MNAARLRLPGITGLPLWDLMVEGVPLHRVRSGFPAALGRAVALLAEGAARREDGSRIAVGAFERVAIGGGGAGAVIAAAVPGAFLLDDPAWVAAAGGAALLRELGARRGAIVDFGQTAVKAISAERRTRHPREPGERAVLDVLVAILTGLDRPDALILAMPCEVGDDLALGTCSYPWSEGDADLLPEALRRAGLTDIPTRVLNDAELAARSAACDVRCRSGRTLVLTIGNGIGGALLALP